MIRTLLLGLVLLSQNATGSTPADPAAIGKAIDDLASFDFAVRTDAARALRRSRPEDVAPALERAVRQHRLEYARFRAFVLLTGIDPLAAGRLARDMLRERDDRVRTVAYQWLEHHPDPEVLPQLLEALPKEDTEFVRPALTRALAAYGADPRAREALAPLVTRGEDLFRGSVIEALGSYKGGYALSAIIAVARLDGPLQDDAITAIGRIGDPEGRAVLADLQRTATREVQPTVSAAVCLLGVDCAARMAYLQQTLAFTTGNVGYQPLLEGVVHALGVMAAAGRPEALTLLFDTALDAREPVRSSLAFGIGLVALRNPTLVLDVLEKRPTIDQPIQSLVDAFDMLHEDFEEERFYTEIRRAFWAAPDGSPRRAVAQALIQKLEF
ncbi:MAG: HEAT repeat domain-containing protein [Vicinamibacterales bacterium]